LLYWLDANFGAVLVAMVGHAAVLAYFTPQCQTCGTSVYDTGPSPTWLEEHCPMYPAKCSKCGRPLVQGIVPPHAVAVATPRASSRYSATRIR
jgi:NAD-dependent SIR2 family protein deacetylase